MPQVPLLPPDQLTGIKSNLYVIAELAVIHTCLFILPWSAQ